MHALMNNFLSRFRIFSSGFSGFDDGSTIVYIPRGDVVRYWSSNGKMVSIYFTYDHSTKRYSVDEPFPVIWERPTCVEITGDEMMDIRKKLFLFMEKFEKKRIGQ